MKKQKNYKKEVYEYWVCVSEPGTIVTIWASDCDIIRHHDCVYFWNNDLCVAFFELHDVLEIVKEWSYEENDYQVVYSKKGNIKC